MNAVKFEFKNEREWLTARTSGIGGSDAPVIAGVGETSLLELYTEKIGIVEPDDISDKDIVYWGKKLEPLVADKYQEETQRSLVNHGIHFFKRSDLGVPLFASLDREIVPINGQGPGDLQIKTTGHYSKRELLEELPIDWQVQIQHELAVMDWEWASLAALLFPSRKLVWVDAQRNDSFIKSLLEKEREFWDRIVHKDPPAPDASESAKKTIAKLYPKDNGKTVFLSKAAIEWDAKLTQAKAQEAQAKADHKQYENLLKMAIGDATFGVLPNAVTYSNKHQGRAGYTVEPTEFRVLKKVK